MGVSRYAGIASRTAAFLVDAVIVVALGGGAVMVAELVGLVVGWPVSNIGNVIVPLAAIGLPLLLATYNFTFWGLVGRTPGMAVMGLRVVRTSGGPISWVSSLIRAVVFMIFPIGTLWCVVDRRRQAIHDKFARTVVSVPVR